MLTNQLRELEQDGLIIRTVYPQVPPKVEYQLSALGQTLKPILVALKEWGDQHIDLYGKPHQSETEQHNEREQHTEITAQVG